MANLHSVFHLYDSREHYSGKKPGWVCGKPTAIRKMVEAFSHTSSKQAIISQTCTPSKRIDERPLGLNTVGPAHIAA